MRNLLLTLVVGTMSFCVTGYSQTGPQAGGTRGESDAAGEFGAKLRALNWVRGPATVQVGSNSKLVIPEHYVFLDAANTAKFDALEQNLSDGVEVMVAPASLEWAAYLEFNEGGYVKDDEKIDADALLTTLKKNNDENNPERQRRGYKAIHLLSWASPPSYNTTTKRLEWATLISNDDGERSANFFTKILGRRGHTAVQLVSEPDSLLSAETSLNSILNGYSFNAGETYTEWRPGDKVAQYGLTALIVGGVAAVAAKKGLFGVIAAFVAGAWKIIAAAIIGALAWIRSLFRKKV